MKDKKLMHMRRTELIEIIYQLQQSEEELRAEVEQLRSELEDRRIRIGTAGSVAEAALSLSGIFEAAQRAADIYCEELRLRAENNEDMNGNSDDSDGDGDYSVVFDFGPDETENSFRESIHDE